VDYLIAFISRILAWVVDFFKWIAEWCWQTVLEALAAVLNAIPVPDWLSGASAVVGSLPAGVAFFLGAAQVPSGLAIVLGAFTIRFFIRRIPLIG
jgi:hypothetical protein